MLKIEVTSYGYYDTIKEIKITLEGALGKSVSKREKDESICKALGAVNALWNLIELNEIDLDAEAKESKNE